MKIFSFSPFGYEGAIVAVEVDLRRGIPAVDIVGLADGAIKESRERMKSAIRNSGFDFPPERVLISLAPADLKKEGSGFDLALALAVLDAQKKASATSAEDFSDEDSMLVLGELELSGVIRPVRGIHAACATAIRAGITKCIVAGRNGAEAREIAGMKVFAAGNLVEAFDALYKNEVFTNGEIDEKRCLPPDSVEIDGVNFAAENPESNFSDVKGQGRLVRALQIAAAGGHNLLAFGPPGCGKTLAMQRFPELLPLLTVEEAQSVTRILSLAGLLPQRTALVRKAPFRQPHQTATIEGMCGGGVNCLPGEVSLAHNGALFLDEAAEFRTSVLQMMRVPMETGSITLSRAGRSTIYPARFQLLMATNPCPCGNFGSEGKICLCSARAIENYWKKFSGPLLDRVDMRVPVQIADSSESADDSFSTAELRKEIARAVKIQRRRQGKRNAFLQAAEIAQICLVDEKDKTFLDSVARNKEFSQRGLAGCLKLARTIADMGGEEKISAVHIAEAVSFRANVGPLSVFDA